MTTCYMLIGARRPWRQIFAMASEEHVKNSNKLFARKFEMATDIKFWYLDSIFFLTGSVYE
jgi:hypothetical protein